MTTRRDDAPEGILRALRAMREIGRLGSQVLPAYARGNASVEGWIKVAKSTGDGRSPAAERTSDPIARMSLLSMGPLLSALDTQYSLGVPLRGAIGDDRTRVDFEALGATTFAPAPSKSHEPSRGGILAVLALDAGGAPIERPGLAKADGRVATDVARGLDILRRGIGGPSFWVEMLTTHGGVVVRATEQATVVVVVECGIELAKIASLVPDPRSFVQLPAATGGEERRGAPVAVPVVSPQRSVAERATSAAEAPKHAPASAGETRQGATHKGLNGSATPKAGIASTMTRALGSGVEVGKWLVGVAGAVRGLGRESATGDRKKSALGDPPAPLVRLEVEDVSTRLLRTAEEYVGPRLLDRMIADTSPSTWAWQNRRVVVRGGEAKVAAERVADVYREIRLVFGKGATLSNALRDFNFDAWLAGVAPEMDRSHSSLARIVLGGASA